jgi:hypothetical protein
MLGSKRSGAVSYMANGDGIVRMVMNSDLAAQHHPTLGTLK